MDTERVNEVRVLNICIMTRQVGFSLSRLASQTALLAAFATSTLWAQPEPAPELGAETASLSQLRDFRSRVTTRFSSDEAETEPILEVLDRAISRLQQAQHWASEAETIQTNWEVAPQLLTDIRERLSRPLADPDIQADQLDLQDLEQRFAEELTVLSSAQHRLNEVVAEREKQSTRRREAPEVVARARRQLAELGQQLQESDLATDTTELGMALRLALEADRRAIVQQIDLYQKAVVSYELRREPLIAQRGDARRRVDESRNLVSRLQEIVDERRLVETRRRADEARAVRVETEPLLAAIAEENERLAELPAGPDGVVSEMTQVSTRLEAVSAQLERLASDFRSVRSKVAAVGRTNAIGYLLRQKKAQLPEIKPHVLNRSRLGEMIREVQLQQIQFGERGEDLLDRFDERVAAVGTRLSDSVSADRLPQMTLAIRDLFQARLRYLEILTSDYDDYFSLLVELDLAERQLIETTGKYSSYISAMVLWTPSAGMLSLEEIAQVGAASEWLR